MAEYVRDNTAPDDRLLVWGHGGGINFLAQREAPTRYLYQYALIMPGYSTDVLVREFLDNLRLEKPSLIIDSNDPRFPPLDSLDSYSGYIPSNFEEVLEFINDSYHIEKEIKGHKIYRINNIEE
ncbi:MAG: hypothetical protein Kow002_00180 [Anaerolineales bacterium]